MHKSLKFYTEKYLNLINDKLASSKFIELLDLLEKYNFTLKIRQEVTYQILDEDLFFEGDDFIYLYNHQLLDFKSWRNTLENSNQVFSVNEKGEALFEISNKLIAFYKFGLFKDLEKEIASDRVLIEQDWIASKSFEFNTVELDETKTPEFTHIVYNGLDFLIDGILVFAIGGNEFFNIDNANDFINASHTKEHFEKLVFKDKDIIDITQTSSYPNLSTKTQDLILAGNQYLEKLLSNKSERILDYSPLLLNYSKAVEIEIKRFFDNNFHLIWPLSDLVLTKADIIKSNFQEKYKANTLISLCREISKFREAYYPSGHKPIAYLLYYLGLGIELEKIIGVEGFIQGSDRERLFKDIAVINRLFLTSNNRNKFVHEITIDSKNEFLLYYYDLISALNLLASIE
jgi:hypothetical protein